jgi:SAM-dependent methyltransferase
MNKSVIGTRLPEGVKASLKRSGELVRAISYYGKGRLCPVCGKSSRRFRPFGLSLREEAQCIHCGALERHRLLWLYLSKRTDLFDGKPKTMLHIAPESCLESIFRQRLGDNYITADLFSSKVMVKMDVTDIHYPDQSFDVIYCSHVLEHVQNDRRAMKEFYRTLKDRGWAILLVPIDAEETFEDPSIVEPEERLRAFGQEDHVRRYGPDYADRLREAGFRVQVTTVADLAQQDEIRRMGLTRASGDIYFCTK